MRLGRTEPPYSVPTEPATVRTAHRHGILRYGAVSTTSLLHLRLPHLSAAPLRCAPANRRGALPLDEYGNPEGCSAAPGFPAGLSPHRPLAPPPPSHPQVSLGRIRWVGLGGVTGVVPLARLGPVAVGPRWSGAERSHAALPSLSVYLEPLTSLVYRQAVLRLHLEAPQVRRVYRGCSSAAAQQRRWCPGRRSGSVGRLRWGHRVAVTGLGEETNRKRATFRP
jgi:hypothetical protein